MASIQQLTSPVEGISCHAWNKDRSMLAFSPNNNEIHIYETRTWNKLHSLTEHDLLVCAIDWSPVTDKIVSCSHDRNAFVWTFDASSNSWKPALAILRIDRAAIDVKWSHDGLRFAVASGAKCVPVCSYDYEHDWWVSKMIKKKFKSTVLCCAFHPSNAQLLATGCADFRCRIISTFDSEIDGTNINPGPFAAKGPLEFGEVYAEMQALGWIHAVAWSPSGNALAYAGHDSSLHIATLNSSPEPVIQTIRLTSLPLTTLLFTSERVILGGGHDFNVTVFTGAGQDWAFHSFLDREDEKEAAVVSESAVSKARELFKNKTVRGQESKLDSDSIKTKHERVIIGLSNATAGNGPIDKVSTSSTDGKLIVWTLPRF